LQRKNGTTIGFLLFPKETFVVMPQATIFLPIITSKRKIVFQGDICFDVPKNKFLLKATPGRKANPSRDICCDTSGNYFLPGATLGGKYFHKEKVDAFFKGRC
jgi:hypothetical protein